MTCSEDTGIVAIGRNEGERLRVCLESAIPCARDVVYVDSGSTDGSLEMARGLGVTVVELDTTVPFTAARARNAGFEALEASADSGSKPTGVTPSGITPGAPLRSAPGLRFVQFVDGDCELDENWMTRARQVMDAEPDVVVVCGRRAERFPQDTVYNLLCDIEWDTPIGEALSCGGDALMRADAFRAVGGFRPDMIAGEEPELCARLRQKGGRVHRIDAPMTLHDARMDSVSQWWTRNVRTGYANAESGAGQVVPVSPGDYRETRSIWLWGGILPSSIVLASLLGHPFWGLLLAVVYPAQIVRISLRRPAPRFSNRDQWIYAVACVLGKIPNFQGQLRYWRGRLTGRRSQLIEYKGPEESSQSSVAETGTDSRGGSA